MAERGISAEIHHFCRNTSFLPKEILPAGRQEDPINTGRLPAEFRQELSAGSPPKGSYGRPLRKCVVTVHGKNKCDEN